MEVRRYAVWEKLKTRFKLEDFGIYTPKMVKPEIVLVSSVDDLLREIVLASSSGLNCSGVAGSYVTAYTVPVGERWYVVGYESSTFVGSTWVAIHKPVPLVSIALTVPATGIHLGWLAYPVKLEAGWKLVFATTGNGSDNAEALSLFYEKELV